MSARGISPSRSIPQDYRRLLAMVEVGGHVEVIRGRLRRFPDQLIDEWLKELEDLQMVESHEAGDLDAITFTGARLPLLPPLSDEDRKRLVKTAVIAERDAAALGFISLGGPHRQPAPIAPRPTR